MNRVRNREDDVTPPRLRRTKHAAAYYGLIRETGSHYYTEANAVLIGDRKLCYQATMLKFCQQQQCFLGVHPWTETAKIRWVETHAQLAVSELVWQDVAYVSQNNARKPETKRPVYRVCEVPHRVIDPQTGEVYEVRWIFSHSSEKAAGDARRREKALAAGEQVLRHMVQRVGKYKYTTRAAIETRLTQELRQAKALDYFTYTLTGTTGSRIGSCAGDGAPRPSTWTPRLMAWPCCAPMFRQRTGRRAR